MKHWYCFLVAAYNQQPHWTGVEYVSDRELFDLIFRTKSENLGSSICPFVYDEKTSNWIWDSRTTEQILGSAQ